jgi:hypothetical protein
MSMHPPFSDDRLMLENEQPVSESEAASVPVISAAPLDVTVLNSDEEIDKTPPVSSTKPKSSTNPVVFGEVLHDVMVSVEAVQPNSDVSEDPREAWTTNFRSENVDV